MTESSSGKRVATMIIGMIVIIGGFFGGFMQFFWIDTHNVGTILFFVLFVPMISFCVGAGIIIYGVRDSIPAFGTMGAFGARHYTTTQEKSYVIEPPQYCKECGASLDPEEVQWVGPLTVKCPYCGATYPAEKREV